MAALSEPWTDDDRALLDEMRRITGCSERDLIRVALWLFAEVLDLNPSIDAFAVGSGTRYRAPVVIEFEPELPFEPPTP